MNTIRRGLAAFALLAAVPGVHAEVKQAAADGFFIRHQSVPLRSTPAQAWAAIIQPQRWWNSEHTWSGKASNLALDAKAGGCWCERWPEGSAEHGRVIMAMPGAMLRLDAALGPLQEFALKAILSFWIREGEQGATTLELEYRVNGSSASGLDQFAPQVNDVLATQFARLGRYLESGNPEAPPEPPPLPEGTAESARRAAIIEEWRRSAEEQAKKDANARPGTPPKP